MKKEKKDPINEDTSPLFFCQIQSYVNNVEKHANQKGTLESTFVIFIHWHSKIVWNWKDKNLDYKGTKRVTKEGIIKNNTNTTEHKGDWYARQMRFE